MKINKVAVIIQNFVQYESFLPAIDVLLSRKIKVDFIIPEKDTAENIWTDMYDDVTKLLNKTNIKIRRNTNEIYDIVFSTHELEQFHNLKCNYFVKYRYGTTTKPWHSLSFKKNYMFDVILCYGEEDSEMHSNFAKTYQIGNIKYAYFNKEKKLLKNNKKKNLLYLPTYGNDSSANEVLPKLKELKNKFNIMIKLHHGTNFLSDGKEIDIKEYVNENFDNVYSSNESLLKLLSTADVVITDNSGAIGDAISTMTPVVIYKKSEAEHYENFKVLQHWIVEEGYVCAVEKIDNLEEQIYKAMTPEYTIKEQMLFQKIFCCDNHGTINKFKEFIDALEKDFLSYEYMQIHNNKKRELREIIDKAKFLEKNNEILEERLNLVYNKLEEIEIENESLKEIVKIKKSNIINKIKRKFIGDKNV